MKIRLAQAFSVALIAALVAPVAAEAGPGRYRPAQVKPRIPHIEGPTIRMPIRTSEIRSNAEFKVRSAAEARALVERMSGADVNVQIFLEGAAQSAHGLNGAAKAQADFKAHNDKLMDIISRMERETAPEAQRRLQKEFEETLINRETALTEFIKGNEGKLEFHSRMGYFAPKGVFPKSEVATGDFSTILANVGTSNATHSSPNERNGQQAVSATTRANANISGLIAEFKQRWTNENDPQNSQLPRGAVAALEAYQKRLEEKRSSDPKQVEAFELVLGRLEKIMRDQQNHTDPNKRQLMRDAALSFLNNTKGNGDFGHLENLEKFLKEIQDKDAVAGLGRLIALDNKLQNEFDKLMGKKPGETMEQFLARIGKTAEQYQAEKTAWVGERVSEWLAAGEAFRGLVTPSVKDLPAEEAKALKDTAQVAFQAWVNGTKPGTPKSEINLKDIVNSMAMSDEVRAKIEARANAAHDALKVARENREGAEDVKVLKSLCNNPRCKQWLPMACSA